MLTTMLRFIYNHKHTYNNQPYIDTVVKQVIVIRVEDRLGMIFSSEIQSNLPSLLHINVVSRV